MEGVSLPNQIAALAYLLEGEYDEGHEDGEEKANEAWNVNGI